MTKRELQERRRRRKIIRRLRMLVKISIYTLFAVILAGVVWVSASRLIKKGDDGKNAEEQEVAAEVEPIVDDAEKVTYTGAAKKKGWNVDDNGWWYLNDDESLFSEGWQTIDGNKYYFDENGYMATGWQQIDGEYYYFKPDGLVEPGATEKLVAITYDDGPSKHTDRLLDCLEANGAKATFFVVGDQIELYPETLKRTESLGMEIGSHTYDHPYLTHLDADGVRDNMNKNEELITSILGHGTAIMRPTGGGINDTVRSTVSQPMIIWDLDTKDWDTQNTDMIVEAVLENVKDGSIVLLHDLYETTIEASEIFIPELVERGYRMVTVSELAELRGVTLESGQDYECFYLPEPEVEEEETEETDPIEAEDEAA